MRRATVIIISLLILAVIEVIMRAIIQGGLRSYIAYLNWPSFTVDFLLGLVIAIITALLYFLLVRSWLKNKLLLIQSTMSGVIIVIFFYIYGVFANGITVNFSVSSNSALLLTHIFVLGFILPFLITGIERIVKPYS